MSKLLAREDCSVGGEGPSGAFDQIAEVSLLIELEWSAIP